MENAEQQAVLNKQVADWCAEVARLQDMIAHATGEPTVTADTPEFREILRGLLGTDGNVWPCLIAHIDAHVAQAVARAVEAQAARVLHLTHERDIALRAARAPAAQQREERRLADEQRREVDRRRSADESGLPG